MCSSKTWSTSYVERAINCYLGYIHWRIFHTDWADWKPNVIQSTPYLNVPGCPICHLGSGGIGENGHGRDSVDGGLEASGDL